MWLQTSSDASYAQKAMSLLCKMVFFMLHTHTPLVWNKVDQRPRVLVLKTGSIRRRVKIIISNEVKWRPASPKYGPTDQSFHKKKKKWVTKYRGTAGTTSGRRTVKTVLAASVVLDVRRQVVAGLPQQNSPSCLPP